MPVQPLPNCGTGGAGADAVDVEQSLLCDVLPNGDIVGSALAVYEYDSEGNPTGAPVFVDPVTGNPYVPQGTLQPCGDTISHAVEILCDVNDADGSAVQFERVKTIGPAGTVLSVSDFGLDGSPYTPLNTVQVCDPLSLCTPESNQDLNAECGPGEPVVQEVLLADLSNPLANSVFNDDDTADPLCGGTWDRPASELPPGFPVAETFRNDTFDQPGPVLQGQPNLPFLTAGPPTNDGDGAGWIRLSDGSYASNGIWQVPAPFSTSEGMNAAVTLASHTGTTPGGDGQYFVFTDGAVGTQATPIGGFGNLGLNNWTGGVFAVVLDEYGQSCTCGQALPSDPNPGPCGFCSNTISIQRAGPSRVGASCACCTVASAPLAPKAINQTTRSQPLRLLTSVIAEAGRTYVSASIDWNDGNGPIQYFERVDITDCITVPPTLRMGLSMNSGGAYQAIKEARDAVARPAGVSNWRAFPITTDAIPDCVTLVNISASVDVTANDDGNQTAGNGNPEAYFWLVNTATNTVLDRDEYSIIPSQLGQVQTLTLAASVPPADVPNLRLYVGAESRDEVGEYDTTWENLTVDATGAGCPATARRTMEISARCPIPVTIVGGGGGEGGGGGTTIVNTPSTFEDQIICATVGGVPQTAFRREVRTPDGGVEVTFLGVNGLPITPDGGWTPGPCAGAEGQTLGPVCWVSDPPVGPGQGGFMTLDGDGTPVLYDTLGAIVPEGTYTIVICPEITQQSHILCDAGNDNQPFLRWYIDSPIEGEADQQWDFELDGSTPYVPVGPVGTCTAGCSTASAIGEVCYSPPVLSTTNYSGNWSGATVTNNGGNSRTYTKANFGGSGETLVFTASASTGAITANGAVLGEPGATPTVSNNVLTFASPKGNVTLTFGFLGTNATERLRNFAPAFTAVGGAGVPVLGNTGVDPTTGDGTVTVTFAGPVSAINFDWTDQGAGASTLAAVSWTELASGQASAPAAVLRDCATGETTYVDLATGTVLTPGSFSIVECSGDQAEAGGDSEQILLCDANGTQFLRTFVRNEAGTVTATVNTTLAGTAFAPVGAVGVCSTPVTPDLDFAEEILCDGNGTAFIRRFTFNSQTGAVTATVNLTLAGAAFVPVGTVGTCSNCCPTVVGNGCTNTGSGFYTAIRATNGTISLIDSVTGAAVTAASIIPCPSDDVTRTLTAQARQLTDATPWTPGGDVAGTLTSLTVTGVSGLWDLVDANGTVLTGLPAGLTLTWEADDDNTLTGPQSVTPQAGASVVAHWTQR